jgi:hypothetical protein
MDGMPMVGLADHLTKTTYDKATQAQTATIIDSSGGVQNIFQHVYPLLEASSVPSLVNRGTRYFMKQLAGLFGGNDMALPNSCLHFSLHSQRTLDKPCFGS